MVLLDKGLDAHAAIPPEVWAKKFVNSRSTGKWQAASLVASLIGAHARIRLHGDRLTDVVEDKSTPSERPRRPGPGPKDAVAGAVAVHRQGSVRDPFVLEVPAGS